MRQIFQSCLLQMAFILIAVAITLTGCSMQNDMKSADLATANFHTQLNAGQYSAIYDSAGEPFKKASTKVECERFFTAVHKKLGDFKSSSVSGFSETATQLQGHLVRVSYNSQFAAGDGVETFIYQIQGQQMILVDYNINSKALLVN